MIIPQTTLALLQKPQKAFILIAAIFGCFYCFITPPFQVPDEYQHFYRTYQVSELGIVAQKAFTECYGRRQKIESVCVGGMLPSSLLQTAKQYSSVPLLFHPENKQKTQEILDLLKIKLQPNKRLFIQFPGAALYSPIPYIPQALGMATGRIFGAYPIVLLYLGRLFNLAVWTGLIYLAIKIIPFYKWLIFLLALTPMSLFQAASLSADALTNSLAFLFTAFILYHTGQPSQPMQRRDQIILIVLGLLLALCKSAYFTLGFLFLLIPTTKLQPLKKYWGNFAIFLASMAVVIFTWSLTVKNLYVPLNPLLGKAVSPSEQITYLLHHPLQFFTVHANTFYLFGNTYIEQYIGKLGWLDTPLPPGLVVSYVIVLILVALTSNQKEILLSGRQKTIIFITAILNTLLITTAMYLSWTEVGGSFIGGIQGRYFIPFAPLFFLLLYQQKLQIKTKLPPSIITAYSLFSCTLTLTTLLNRYYL